MDVSGNLIGDKFSEKFLEGDENPFGPISWYFFVAKVAETVFEKKCPGQVTLY